MIITPLNGTAVGGHSDAQSQEYYSSAGPLQTAQLHAGHRRATHRMPRRKVVIEAGLGHVSVWGRCRISQSIIVLLGINSTALQNISQNLIRKNIFCTAPCPKFGNDFCAHGIIPNCSLFNFIHMRYDDTINVENNIGIKEFISNH